MAEYVCEVVTEHELCGDVHHYVRRERIVRCRNCKHAIEHRSKSILGSELVTLICSGPIQGAYSEGADVEPEDFCSCGEPRKED